MKRTFFFILFSVSMISCEKDLLLPDSEVPDWLKERIANDEAIIQSNPQSGLDAAAWIRYRYDGNYYFEYLNLLSSAFPAIYSYEGVQTMTLFDNYQDFISGRCCKIYVWKGKSYTEID